MATKQRMDQKTVMGLTCECGQQFLSGGGLAGHRRNCEQSSSFHSSSQSLTMNSNNNQSGRENVSMRPSLSVNISKTKSQKAKFMPTVCCGIPINTANGIKSHMRSARHKEVLASQSMASQPLQYPEEVKCNVCNEGFVDEACLSVHKATCK